MAGFTNDKFEPEYYGIGRKAIRQWAALSEAMQDEPWYPCLNNPYYYTDYEGHNLEPLTVDDCESLCADCPLLKLCYDFAVASEQEHGIWGGISFYKNMTVIDGKHVPMENGNIIDDGMIF